MLPQYMYVDKESKAALWMGAPTAVYKLDLVGLQSLRDENFKKFKMAIFDILDWMTTYENDHDAWVLTPSSYIFASGRDGVDISGATHAKHLQEPNESDKLGDCIGNCMMPIQYSVMDPETTRRCLLTCTDGAAFEEDASVRGEWTTFSNNVFYQDQQERCSKNILHHMLMNHTDAHGDMQQGTCPLIGPAILTCF